VAVKRYTVECAEHGPMERDQVRFGWLCTAGNCRAALPDEEVIRLVTAAPADAPDPLPLVVT